MEKAKLFIASSALALLVSFPLAAQEAPSAPQALPPVPRHMERHGQGWHNKMPVMNRDGNRGRFVGYGCRFLLMEGDPQMPRMRGLPGVAPDQAQEDDILNPFAWAPQDMMQPEPKDSKEIAQLKQEIRAQHEKLLADKTQMRADCQRMHELLLRMHELRAKARGARKDKTSRAKGNSAPASPVIENK